METNKVTFGEFVAGTAVLVLSVAFRGFVLSMLWKWFVVSTFGIAALSIPVAIGFTVIVNLVLSGVARKETNEKGFLDMMAGAMGTSAFVLFLGWIVSLFV